MGDSRDIVTPAELRAEVERRAAKEAAKAKRKPRRVRNTSQKGKRGERRFVDFWKGLGFVSFRHAGSGAFEGLKHDGSVRHPANGSAVTFESKWFAGSRVRTLEKMRDGADMLVLYRDQDAPGQLRPEGEILMRESVLAWIVSAAIDLGRRAAEDESR